MKVRELFGLSHVSPQPQLVMGVELEIENTRASDFAGFGCVEDGSLRNSGYEFVSRPFTKDMQMTYFKGLHGAILPRTAGIPMFSPRTSIHVHANCLDLDVEQAKAMVLWYSLFEPVFFSMVDQLRSNSVFCVPLDQTVMPGMLCRTLKFCVQGWSKYTAFNIKPLGEKGTIEFRHMHGHNDAQLHEEWLSIIENLWTFSQNNVPNKLTLRKDSFVQEAYDKIFAGSRVANLGNMVHNVVEDNLINLKLALL